MVRQIVCFQIPALQIALARLDEPSLRGRPVAVAPGSHRAALFEVSAEALAEGVYAGMPLEHARWFCPSLKIVSPRPESAWRAHHALLESLRHFTPVWEPIVAGSFYLDLTGTARLFGRAVDAAARMEREAARRCGIAGVVGVAVNKLVSHIAADAVAKPADLYDVIPGGEKEFLAPRPVASLPTLHRLYGAKTPEFLKLFRDLNLDTLGEIAGTPPAHLELAFGPQSRLLREWAVGFDPTPVWPQASRPALEVSHTLSPDEVDDGALLALLYGLLEKLCRALRRRGRLCRRIELDLAQSDARETIRRALLERASRWECEIYPRLEELFFRAFQRRVRVRKMTLRAEALEEEEKQLALFPPAIAEEDARSRRLASALDRVRSRYGEKALVWGAA
jgi:DNA polymerase-4